MKIEWTTFMSVKNISLLSLIIILSIASCKNNDEVEISCEPLKPSTYNKTNHVYATMLDFNNSQGWETIIDLETGLFDTIAGSGLMQFGINGSLGTRNLTDFDGEKKIYINHDNILVIQDLTTFDSMHIDLINPISGSKIVFPQHLNFGGSNNIVYLLSAYNEIFSVNLTSQEISLVKDISVDQSQFSDFIYLKESNDFVFFGQKNFGGGNVEYRVSLFDSDTDEILYTDSLPHFFGFVKHPENDDIFALTIPSADKGFRLMKLQVMENEVNILQLSSSDLAIDELSPYIQTIHTETNSYICRGGTAFIDQPNSNRLYSISLVNGTVTKEVELEGYKTMSGLQGE